MPIEIRELHIKTTVQKSDPDVDTSGLCKQVGSLVRICDDAFDERESALDAVSRSAQALVKSVSGAGRKLVEQLIDQVKDERRAVAKARAAAEEAARCAAAAKAKAGAKGGADAEADEEKGDYATRLKAALSNLRSAKKPYTCIVNLVKPADLFWLNRGLINPKQKEMLTGLSGSKVFSKLGTVTRDGNTLVIEMDGAGSGMASRIQVAIQKAIGLRLKVQIGADVAEEAEPGAKESAPAARPVPTLAKAPQLWNGTHEMLAKRIAMLKDSVRKHYGPQGAQVLATIDKQLAELDAVTDKLDKSLSDALAAVAKAPQDKRREAAAAAARQAADYIAWVKKDPIVRHIDGNPFGVPTQIEQTVTRSLGEIAKSLAA